MFRDNKRIRASEDALFSVLGNAARLEGKFTISDSISIECEVAGEINVGGKLVIGEKGTVRADVHTVDALIKGQYEGDMVATGDVEITGTGRVTGNIETDSLVISKGGFFNGSVFKIDQQRKEAPERRGGPALVDAAKLDKKHA